MNYNEIINQLFEGDCLKYLKQFPDNSIDIHIKRHYHTLFKCFLHHFCENNAKTNGFS